jgi:hypothetical protein
MHTDENGGGKLTFLSRDTQIGDIQGDARAEAEKLWFDVRKISHPHHFSIARDNRASYSRFL